MFRPDVVSASDALLQAHASIREIDAFAYAAMNSRIGSLSPDPEWIPPVRNQLRVLSDAGAAWQQTRPRIWAEVLSPFLDYSSMFAGFAEAAEDAGDSRELWISLLDPLATALGNHATAVRVAEQEFKQQRRHLKNVEAIFDSSLGTAWSKLGEEEETMVALAGRLGALQERLGQLQSDLTSGMISADKDLVKTTITLSYSVLTTAGASFPFLTIAGLLFTVGKAGYDLVVTDQKIKKTLDEIMEIQVDASVEAQALALTKGLIQMIQGFSRSILATEDHLPKIGDMWLAEQEKVREAVSSLRSGTEPSRLFSLRTLHPAVVAWDQLAKNASRLLGSPVQGRPVRLGNVSTFDQASVS